jgi:hypothetical protein
LIFCGFGCHPFPAICFHVGCLCRARKMRKLCEKVSDRHSFIAQRFVTLAFRLVQRTATIKGMVLSTANIQQQSEARKAKLLSCASSSSSSSSSSPLLVRLFNILEERRTLLDRLSTLHPIQGLDTEKREPQYRVVPRNRKCLGQHEFKLSANNTPRKLTWNQTGKQPTFQVTWQGCLKSIVIPPLIMSRPASPAVATSFSVKP